MQQFNQRQFNIFTGAIPGGGGRASGWKPLFFLGLALVFFALLIVSRPELLVYLIAGGIFFLGFSVLGVSLTLRRMEKQSKYQP